MNNSNDTPVIELGNQQFPIDSVFLTSNTPSKANHVWLKKRKSNRISIQAHYIYIYIYIPNDLNDSWWFLKTMKHIEQTVIPSRWVQWNPHGSRHIASWFLSCLHRLRTLGPLNLDLFSQLGHLSGCSFFEHFPTKNHCRVLQRLRKHD